MCIAVDCFRISILAHFCGKKAANQCRCADAGLVFFKVPELRFQRRGQQRSLTGVPCSTHMTATLGLAFVEPEPETSSLDALQLRLLRLT